MLVKALKSFGGKISMYAGEIRDIVDQKVLNDLIRAGHVEPEAQEAEVVEKPAKKSTKKAKSTKKSKTNK